MHPTAICCLILGLLLCTIPTIPTSAAPSSVTNTVPRIPIKEGTCPRNVNIPTCLPSDKIKNECEVDVDCKGKMKCCQYQCKKQCLLPLEAKNNSCPSIDYLPCLTKQKKPSLCFTDDQCPGTERCCCSNCQRRCTPTVTVKPGECPPAQLNVGKFCKQDSDCSGKMKCCDHRIIREKTCKDPVPEHNGYCPGSQLHLTCDSIDKATCSRDSDCLPTEKCCVSDNTMNCVKAIKEKNGKCPAPSEKCVYIGANTKFQSDKDCPDIKKCCPCGSRGNRQCTDAKITRPGSCPTEEFPPTCSIPFPLPLCTGDEYCPENYKCCYSNCQMKCVRVLV